MANSLETLVQQDREAAFFRLRGGYPIALAGAAWWLLLGFVGYRLKPHLWIFVAFCTSGLIFPVAMLFARIAGVNFMRDRTSVSSAVFPAFVSMLLFWPMAISAYWSYPQLVPLILAIGLSMHWPVIGWTYAKTGLYAAHAIVRAIVCSVLWNWMPQARFTLLPLSVALVYLLTVAAIVVQSSAGAKERALHVTAA